jgi:Uma2 family endonuclease
MSQWVTRDVRPSDMKSDPDQVVHLSNVTWADYERIAATRGESAIPRLTYCDGVLELMSPGHPHEYDKTTLARLFEAYADHLQIWAEGIGSWTIKSKKKKQAAEADECYVFDKRSDSVECPELVIEVIYHSGGLDKLPVWHRLGAKEVWIWTQQRKLEIFVRKPKAFVPAERSKVVPRIDTALIARCMAKSSQQDALRALRAALRRRSR